MNGGEAQVIPIILRPTLWDEAPFHKLQVLPKDGKPVIKWRSQDEAFTNIARGIRDASRRLAKKPVEKIALSRTQIRDTRKVNAKPEEDMTQGSNRDNEIGKQWDTFHKDIGDIIEKARALIDEEFQRDPSRKELRELQPQFERCYRIWHDQHFQVAILGMLKAGKSTLINAFLGKRGLHATSKPATASIVRVRHEPMAADGRLSELGEVLAEGMENIHSYLRDRNNQIRSQKTEMAEEELLLEAPFMALAGQSLEQQGFEILDTPGFGEAGAETLGQKSAEVLEGADIIICLLNYSNLTGD